MRGSRSIGIKKMDNIIDLITELARCSSEGVPILVEGRKDELALKELGVKGRVIRVGQYGKRLFELVEELSSYRAVIILTDFDQEGEKLADELSKRLRSLGVQTIMRDKFRNGVSWVCRQIEGLQKIDGLRENLNNRQFIINSS